MIAVVNPLVFIVFGVLLAAVLAALALDIERTRRRALAAWAKEHGFEFSAGWERPPRLPSSLAGRGSRGRRRYLASKRIEGAVPGLDFAEFLLFSYEAAGGSQDNAPSRFTCALVDAGLELGDVVVVPEGPGERILQAMGLSDIEFEDAGFSRRFSVRARDRRRAYALIDRRVMDLLMEEPEWRIETAGPDLLVFRPGAPNPAAYSEILDFTRDLLERIPRPLVNAERERCGLPPVLDAGNAAEFHRRPGR
jgi:hypothetical protein